MGKFARDPGLHSDPIRPKSNGEESGCMELTQADVSAKPVVFREATATGRIRLRPETVKKIRSGELEKGDVIGVAKTMGVLAAKRTPDLIALCHPLKIEATKVELKVGRDSVQVTVTVSAHERTGVEMEALMAVSVALLNVWDMVKAYEKDGAGQYPATRIEEIKVVKKVKRNEGA